VGTSEVLFLALVVCSSRTSVSPPPASSPPLRPSAPTPPAAGTPEDGAELALPLPSGMRSIFKEGPCDPDTLSHPGPGARLAPLAHPGHTQAVRRRGGRQQSRTAGRAPGAQQEWRAWEGAAGTRTTWPLSSSSAQEPR